LPRSLALSSLESLGPRSGEPCLSANVLRHLSYQALERLHRAQPLPEAQLIHRMLVFGA